MKKLLTKELSIISLLLVGMISACSSGQNKETFNEEIINFERISTVKQFSPYLDAGEERTIPVNFDILDNNYLKLVVTSEVDIYGTFEYSNIEDTNEKGYESFFIPAKEEEQELCHFLDAFRPAYNYHSNCNANGGAHAYYNIPMETKMAQGLFCKKLNQITIKNVSDNPGHVLISGLYYSNRKLPQEEVYLTKGYLKIGVDLMGGGTLTYLERLNYQTSKTTYYIDEVLTPSNDIYIGVNATRFISNPDEELGSKNHHVNLINYYDAGRQFQQSFYAAVGGSQEATNGENGYMRKMCYTGSSAGYYWPYNPVQGGDCHTNISQVVDYRISADTIYVKCKPLDWADNNYVTNSYMENWYSIKNNCVYVKNRFVNFEGFSNMEKCSKVQLELPASYIVHPFNNFVTYQGESPWTEDQTGLVYRPNLGNWAHGADITLNHPEDWFAWLNNDDFGVGVYIPEVSFYASGRSNSSVNYSYGGNSNAFSSPMGDADRLKYNKQPATYSYQSCYCTNTCYTAPEIMTTMLDYLPFEYSYVMSVDYLPIIRNNFKIIYKHNEIDNSSLFVWDKEVLKRT